MTKRAQGAPGKPSGRLGKAKGADAITRKLELRCEHCGKKLRQDQAVYLELSAKTNQWYPEGECPAEESQGSFPVGKTCAKTLLRETP